VCVYLGAMLTLQLPVLLPILVLTCGAAPGLKLCATAISMLSSPMWVPTHGADCVTRLEIVAPSGGGLVVGLHDTLPHSRISRGVGV
jgi:hypothetical protein